MLRLGESDPIEMFGFSDASHITSGKRESRHGGALYLDNFVFIWDIRKPVAVLTLAFLNGAEFLRSGNLVQ